MPTRYEFGIGDGETYRRRMDDQDKRHRQAEEERSRLPDEERAEGAGASDYYGFRGAGRRSRHVEEYRVQPRSGREEPQPREPLEEQPRR